MNQEASNMRIGRDSEGKLIPNPQFVGNENRSQRG